MNMNNEVIKRLDRLNELLENTFGCPDHEQPGLEMVHHKTVVQYLDELCGLGCRLVDSSSEGAFTSLTDIENSLSGIGDKLEELNTNLGRIADVLDQKNKS
ncbi:MAG: hypothetical protein M2R45_03582 [Verrucomicrobia subdivision 3 bacterium]|nr:hypothetical protein [Limisphaerales bacterium]MCS1414785.1 hypothetical protein [Limisphaerales bacterium]